MTMVKIMPLAAACVLTAATFAASPPALAKRGGPITVIGRAAADVLSERVSYRDLNLASVQGEKRLVYRVRGAIGRVCPDDGTGPLNELNRCRSYAWDGAEPQIDLAVKRAREIATNGFSAIAPVAIVIATKQ